MKRELKVYSAKIAGVTQPIGIEGINTAEEFIAYCARVSNPDNQFNTLTADKLIGYLIREKHWSPFEMVHVNLEVEVTRDIGRQVLRHGTFKFQEFSQRYASVHELGEGNAITFREARTQDHKNRQNSNISEDADLDQAWYEAQQDVSALAMKEYSLFLENGGAKEQARAILPEGLTNSRMYMSGTLRSWLHYCDLRMANGTQAEHMWLAESCYKVIQEYFPDTVKAFDKVRLDERLAKQALAFMKKHHPQLIEDWS